MKGFWKSLPFIFVILVSIVSSQDSCSIKNCKTCSTDLKSCTVCADTYRLYAHDNTTCSLCKEALTEKIINETHCALAPQFTEFKLLDVALVNANELSLNCSQKGGFVGFIARDNKTVDTLKLWGTTSANGTLSLSADSGSGIEQVFMANLPLPPFSTYSRFSLTNNASFFFAGICVNEYNQTSQKRFSSFNTKSNGGRNFSLILIVDTPSINATKATKDLICVLRDELNLKSTSKSNTDTVQTEDGISCGTLYSRILGDNPRFLQAASTPVTTDLAFFVSHDTKAEKDSSISNVKTKISNINQTIAFLNDAIKKKAFQSRLKISLSMKGTG